MNWERAGATPPSSFAGFVLAGEFPDGVRFGGRLEGGREGVEEREEQPQDDSGVGDGSLGPEDADDEVLELRSGLDGMAGVLAGLHVVEVALGSLGMGGLAWDAEELADGDTPVVSHPFGEGGGGDGLARHDAGERSGGDAEVIGDLLAEGALREGADAPAKGLEDGVLDRVELGAVGDGS